MADEFEDVLGLRGKHFRELLHHGLKRLDFYQLCEGVLLVRLLDLNATRSQSAGRLQPSLEEFQKGSRNLGLGDGRSDEIQQLCGLEVNILKRGQGASAARRP